MPGLLSASGVFAEARFDDPLWIAGQLFGLIALVLLFLSYQCASPKKLLLIQTAGTVSTMLGYLCLGATAGMLLNGICVIRNLIYYFRSKKIFSYRFWPWLLAALMAAAAIPAWTPPAPLLVFALMINTVVLSLGDNRGLRYSILLTSPMVIVYNLLVGAYGSIPCEAFVIVSAVIALVRYRGKNEER
ncbi:MAG: YgjV family protein [Clostridia bacterium]|nr:YgjV family protein [Clostridia bacterium]MBP5270424.1 YgjV family protein [Clostridia bacterium]